MRLTCNCPQCEQPMTVQVDAESRRLECPHCGAATMAPADAVGPDGPTRCLVCPGAELYLKKDFPQKIGFAVVVVASIASAIAWYNYQFVAAFAILFVMAAIDLVLALTMPEALVCYRCGAQYRGLTSEQLRRHERFDLEVHERYRQERARAVAAPHQRS